MEISCAKTAYCGGLLSGMRQILQRIDSAADNNQLLPESVANLKLWIDGEILPEWAWNSLWELIEGEAWEELNDRFYKNLAFGTGGLRGRTIARLQTAAEKGELSPRGTPAHAAVGSACMNDFNVVRATIGLFRYCDNYLRDATTNDGPPKLVVAHDVRHFSRHFCELTVSTWQQLGGEAFLFDGPRSTPQLSYSVRHLGATAGIVITASHNPPHDNGYKVYFRDGGQIVSPHAEGIIGEVNRVDLVETGVYLEKNLDGVVTLGPEVDTAYAEALEENVLDPALLKRVRPKVVFTPIHGTGGIMATPLMKRFGVEVVPVDDQEIMDPRFPTVRSPNPENAEALSQAIEKAIAVGADLVLATDPDADRMGVGVLNRHGKMELLTGNMIGSVLAEYRICKLKEMGWLPREGSARAAIIKTFVTTPLQAAIAEAHGLKLINTLTGFKFIGDKLADFEAALEENLFRKEGREIDYDTTGHRELFDLHLKYGTYFVFGGEESYGYLASDRLRDKDANAAVIMFCELVAALKEQGQTVGEFLDEMYVKYGCYSERLLNIVHEGASGSIAIGRILESYRKNPPRTIGGVGVKQFTDFGVDEVFDADGKEIPKQDFYFLELENGYSYAVRGSGTEPKIKFYLFAREEVAEPAALPEAKGIAAENLVTLERAIEADAEERSRI